MKRKEHENIPPGTRLVREEANILLSPGRREQDRQEQRRSNHPIIIAQKSAHTTSRGACVSF
jgi:hypothetical protein